MAVRVIDSQGRRQGLPGKRAKVYTVANKYGGMLIDEHAIGLVIYRAATLNVAASTWLPVTFDTLFQADGQSRNMFTASSSTVTFVESDWYMLSSTFQFNPPSGVNVWTRFRFSLSGGVYLPGGTTYLKDNYSLPMNGAIPWYISAGTTMTVDVSHTYASTLTMQGGFGVANLKIARLTG
jgi:hypothetical protein